MSVIVITEKAWANCPLSIARYSGRVKYNGHEYVIVDKRGHDIFECSAEAEKEGRKKAIEPAKRFIPGAETRGFRGGFGRPGRKAYDLLQ